MRLKRVIIVVLALAALRAPAEARVVFTGYGDFQLTLRGRTTVGGPPALLGALGVRDTVLHSRGGGLAGLGFFAVTEIDEGLTFENDVTYRDVGFNAGRVQLQYAFLSWEFAPDSTLRAGKITLPIGYYNRELFYPFRRPSISAPLFYSAILGLPIADLGLVVDAEREFGPLRARAELYGVNGYGHQSASTAAFRSGTVAGGLSTANNLKATNANDELAYGARAALSPVGAENFEWGVSFYNGDWDAKGERLFRMWNTHARAAAGGWDFLVEALWTRVEGDQGFAANLGDGNWGTYGGFFSAAYDRLRWRERALTPWLRLEWYRSEAAANRFGAETVMVYTGGFAWALRPAVQLKVEWLRLEYAVPFKPAGTLTLDADIFSGGLTLTF